MSWAQRRGNLLVIDDEPLILKSVSRILSRQHEVVTLTAARDALVRCAAGEKFDLILCDLAMPEMSGIDFHRELSMLAYEQAQRIVFITGGAFTEDARNFLAALPADYLEKPFDAHRLRALVDGYMRRASVAPLTERSTPEARAAISAELIVAVDAESDAAYAVDADGRIVFVNCAWDAFARANGGAAITLPIGESLWNAVPDVLRPFYERGYAAAATGEPWTHEYECSSPTTQRWFRMRVLRSGEFMFVTNSLIHEVAAEAGEVADSYAGDGGLIRQCAHCRRVHRRDGSAWDWVPALVEARPGVTNVSHGLCETCLEYHYPAR